MKTVEYRGWITIPDLPFSMAAEHERLHDALLASNVDLGPVMTWAEDATVVVLAVEAEDEAAAAQVFTAAVSDALHVAQLGHLYPAGVDLELADDLVPA